MFLLSVSAARDRRVRVELKIYLWARSGMRLAQGSLSACVLTPPDQGLVRSQHALNRGLRHADRCVGRLRYAETTNASLLMQCYQL